ncbi:MAG: hypothetical protein AB1921_03395 [Thermodesulfobacteriota bacterium]
MFVILIPMGAYFVVWVFGLKCMIKFKNSLYEKFPKQTHEILGPKRIFMKPHHSISFFWNKRIRGITKRDRELEALRVKASKYMIAVVVGPFAAFALTLILAVLISS